MSKHSSTFNSIPHILAVPEKLSAFMQRLLKLRFPVERHFSGRDILFLSAAALMMILSAVVRPLFKFRLGIWIIAAVCAAVPLLLQGYHRIRIRKIPVEELTWFLAAVISCLAGEFVTAPVILIFAGVLAQTESYCMLHRDAASDYLSEARLELRKAIECADEEKSAERRALATASLCFYGVFVLAAILLAIFGLFHLSEYRIWLHRSMILLILASPSSFLFSSMLTHFGAVYSAAKSDILFEVDQIPEDFSKCRLFAFSKTGTITDGKYVINEISPVGMSEGDLLRIAAIAEYKSEHPIAVALKSAAGMENGVIQDDAVDTKEMPGKGVSTYYAGHHIYAGNAGLLEEHEIWCRIPDKSGSAVHVALDGNYCGYLLVSDAIRKNAFEALEELRSLGAQNLILLTGDVRSASRTLASSLNFDMVKPELDEKGKGSAIRYLRSAHGEKARITCVGDGIHDAEMFAEADVSICLEEKGLDSGSSIRIFNEDIEMIPLAYLISRRTERILLINTIAITVVKLMLAAFGIASVLPAGVIAAVNGVVGIVTAIYCLTCFTIAKRERQIT